MSASPPSRAWTDTLCKWFVLRDTVSRREYVIAGVSLMLFKYAVDAGVVALATGKLWSPLDHLSPISRAHVDVLADGPAWVGWALVVWTLPFLWIGLGMSVRRASDAGLSPWIGFLFVCPLVNYVAMIVLAVLPTRAPEAWRKSDLTPMFRATMQSALFAGGVALVIALAMMTFSVYVLRDYGWALFGMTPLAMGAVSGYLLNRAYPHGLAITLIVAMASVFCAASAMLLFALEGALCVTMALPIAIPLALIGAYLGRAMALNTSLRRTTALCLLVLPGSAALEKGAVAREVHEVRTSIEVAAPPAVVWRHVVSFRDLAEPREWIFKTGVAYPVRATIEGGGVGAIRRCEFSTGAFVEPITVWDAPARLAFDVESQPDTMQEWSPFADVRPPHLDGFFRSTRGEFRLVELEDGRTLLCGSTWYELDIHPRGYWSIWADYLVHEIHMRVLEHVKDLAESGA